MRYSKENIIVDNYNIKMAKEGMKKNKKKSLLSFQSVLIQVQTDYKVINLDQWMGFYRFCQEVQAYSCLSFPLLISCTF